MGISSDGASTIFLTPYSSANIEGLGGKGLGVGSTWSLLQEPCDRLTEYGSPRAVGVRIHVKVLLSSAHRHSVYWQPSHVLALNWLDSARVTFTYKKHMGSIATLLDFSKTSERL